MTGRPTTTADRRGFTLLELLVVLVIAGLILTLAPPLLRGGGGTEVEAKARELAAALRLTRSEAITRNRPLAVAFDADARRYLSAATEPGVFPEDFRVSFRVAADRSDDPWNSRSEGRIRFFPDGSSSGGTVSLAKESHRYDVRVDWLTGHVSIDGAAP